MKKVTAAEVREAVLVSLDLEETDLGTAVLEVDRGVVDGDWDLKYADSCGTFEGKATVDSTGAVDVWWDEGDFED